MNTEHWTIIGIGITAFIVCGYIWRIGQRKPIQHDKLAEAEWWVRHATKLFHQAIDAAHAGDVERFEKLQAQHNLCYRRFHKLKEEIEAE